MEASKMKTEPLLSPTCELRFSSHDELLWRDVKIAMLIHVGKKKWFKKKAIFGVSTFNITK